MVDSQNMYSHPLRNMFKLININISWRKNLKASNSIKVFSRCNNLILCITYHSVITLVHHSLLQNFSNLSMSPTPGCEPLTQIKTEVTPIDRPRQLPYTIDRDHTHKSHCFTFRHEAEQGVESTTLFWANGYNFYSYHTITQQDVALTF